MGLPGVKLGDIWVKRSSGERIKVLSVDPPFELSYELLPPHNKTRNFGVMFYSTLKERYELENS